MLIEKDDYLKLKSDFLQDAKMEYLAVVVANKNQISSLSPLIGANWPGAVSDQPFPILKLIFFSSEKVRLNFQPSKRGAFKAKRCLVKFDHSTNSTRCQESLATVLN